MAGLLRRDSDPTVFEVVATRLECVGASMSKGARARASIIGY